MQSDVLRAQKRRLGGVANWGTAGKEAMGRQLVRAWLGAFAGQEWRNVPFLPCNRGIQM